MEVDRIPIRIGNNRHSTGGILERLDKEFGVAGAQIAYGGIEIIDLESNRRPITRRFPFLLEHVANGKSR